jgi:hypothetical protein
MRHPVVTAEKKYALIIANSVYEDALLRQLIAPPQDAEGLAQVLADPSICGFEVRTLLDEPSYRVCEEIEDFFEQRERDDLTLLYFSGHGITDDDGLLYYAARNTKRNRLRATAVAAPWVNEMITRCRSRRQVLLLDCCHSGAFARTKSAATVNVGQQLAASAREEGRGRFVITASDAFQYSFEGDSVEGEGVYSVFTQALVQGLRSGEADLDSDGLITLDELYRFVHRRVREQTPQQSPRKWESDAEGTMVIGLNPRPAEAALPDDLLHAIENLMPEARERAIPRLNTLLRGKHRGLALAAERALISLAEDDSRRVSTAASKCLEEFRSEAQKAHVAPALAPPSLKPLPPAIPQAASVTAETPLQRGLPAVDPAISPEKFTRPAAKASVPPMLNVPAVLSASAPAESETSHRAEIETLPKSVRDPRGSVAAPRPEETVTPVQFPLATDDLPAASSPKRARERWHSLSQPVQILVCAAAVGLGWGALPSLSYLTGLASPSASTFLSLVSASALGVVLAFALPPLALRMTRNMRLMIVAIWIIRAIVGALLYQFVSAILGFANAAATGLYLTISLLFFDVIAGSVTGAVFARATGRSLARGLVIGGLSFFLSRLLANGFQSVVLASGSQQPHFTIFVEAAFFGFVRGSTGVLGILWFLRRRHRPA